MEYKKSKTHFITQCALFSAFICLISPLSIPFGIIPVSLSLFAVVLAATVLPVKKAMVSVVAYLFTGLCGMPVFAGFNSGVTALSGPAGGFLWGYLLLALVVSLTNRKGLNTKIFFAFLGLIILYICGTLHYMVVCAAESIYKAFLVCVLPFVLFDAFKIVSAIILGEKIKGLLAKMGEKL